MDRETEVAVSITADDIEHGWRGNAYHCPIAHALRRQFPEASDLYVLYTRAYLKQTAASQYEAAVLPKQATDFIEDFDFSKAKEPTGFTLFFRTLKRKPKSALRA